MVGFAGSDEKCTYLTNELGFDAAFNYKTTSVEAALAEGAPDGVDCFFDNVGGPASSVIINHMNNFGRYKHALPCIFISNLIMVVTIHAGCLSAVPSPSTTTMLETSWCLRSAGISSSR